MVDPLRSKDVGCRLGDNPGDVSSTASDSSAEAARAIAYENELVRRVRAGERELYYQLVAPNERRIYVIAHSILRNEAEAEDCVQDAVLKAFRHLDQFRGDSRFGSWLVRITINEAKMRLRKLRPQLYESLDNADGHDEGGCVPRTLGDWREIPSETLERKEVREMIVNAVESLSEIYKEVFVLRDVEGNDVATTAEILGISVVAVKTRLLRARLQLRDILAPLIKKSGLFSKKSGLFSREPFKKGKNPWL